jgi:hypothetical protein
MHRVIHERAIKHQNNCVTRFAIQRKKIFECNSTAQVTNRGADFFAPFTRNGLRARSPNSIALPSGR